MAQLDHRSIEHWHVTQNLKELGHQPAVKIPNQTYCLYYHKSLCFHITKKSDFTL